MGEGLKRARAAAKATRKSVVTSRGEYVVDGGEVVGEDRVRIDLLLGEELGATFVVPRDEASFYPIGAKVRVTVERLK